MPNKRYFKGWLTAQRFLLAFFFFNVVFIVNTEKYLSRANGLELLVRLSECVLAVIVVLICWPVMIVC